MGIKPSKKDEERDFLAHVYGDIDFFEVLEESEDPDFKLRDKRSDTVFGVEVTKLFYSETSARSKNIEGYLSTALKNPAELDKRDLVRLKPWDLTVINESGEELSAPIKGILSDSPRCWPEYTCRVINSIYEKGLRFDNYNKDLKHVNLIIYDMECGFRIVPEDKFEEVFTQRGIGNDLIKYLKETKFERVYLVTDLLCPEGVKKVNIELKRTFLK